ncbi:hypothetical protein HYPSUDRAFT_609506 [Hypholoma sublateritium FD-334 SS-4]|uniref:Uncharacterized protein n=1 Tax=Hypholoma sublateritium (strain FD-334 SS-4) TaxID=945553 RepID=A0A0D2PT70_HYPSF|nr:hypothetical protein HYPSUDRAFT_609506 [Hypholoma sublateritium FD-334 SS-4]
MRIVSQVSQYGASDWCDTPRIDAIRLRWYLLRRTSFHRKISLMDVHWLCALRGARPLTRVGIPGRNVAGEAARKAHAREARRWKLGCDAEMPGRGETVGVWIVHPADLISYSTSAVVFESPITSRPHHAVRSLRNAPYARLVHHHAGPAGLFSPRLYITRHSAHTLASHRPPQQLTLTRKIPPCRPRYRTIPPVP